MIEIIKEWLENNVLNTTNKNENTGFEIIINSTSIGKWFSKKLGTSKIKAFTAIQDIVKTAVYVGSDKDNKNRKEIEKIHNFWSVVEVDDVVYPFGFNVRETTDGKFIYDTIFVFTPKTPKPSNELEGFHEGSAPYSTNARYGNPILNIRKNNIKSSKKSKMLFGTDENKRLRLGDIETVLGNIFTNEPLSQKTNLTTIQQKNNLKNSKKLNDIIEELKSLKISKNNNDLLGFKDDNNELLAFLEVNAVPFRFIKYKENSFVSEFGHSGEVATPIGLITIDYIQFDKISYKDRESYFGLILPTLTEPCLVIWNELLQKHFFIKSFIDKKRGTIYFVSISKEIDGVITIVTNHEKRENQIKKIVQEGAIAYQINSGENTALGKTEILSPNHYTFVHIGLLYYLNTEQKKEFNKFQNNQLGNLELQDLIKELKSLKIPKKMKVQNIKSLNGYAEDENLKKQIKSYIDTSVDFYLNDEYKFDNFIWSVAGDSNKEVRKQIMSYLLGRKVKSNEYGITDIKWQIVSKADYKLKIQNLIKELKSLKIEQRKLGNN